MPDPARLVTPLRSSIALTQSMPGRTGRIVALPPVRDILVVGDLHGNLGNFQAILQKAELAANPGRHLVLQEVVHSPFRYPDGGDKSHQLLDLTAALTCQFPGRVHFLLGNHELAQWQEQLIGKGDEDYNELFRQGVQTAYGPRVD